MGPSTPDGPPKRAPFWLSMTGIALLVAGIFANGFGIHFAAAPNWKPGSTLAGLGLVAFALAVFVKAIRIDTRHGTPEIQQAAKTSGVVGMYLAVIASGGVGFGTIAGSFMPEDEVREVSYEASPPPRESAPKAKMAKASYVHIGDWENKGAEDLTFCAVANGPGWEGDPKCWEVSGHSDKGWLQEPVKLNCRVDMDQFYVALYTVDTQLMNERNYAENLCHGDDHSYEITATASYRISVALRY